MNILRSIPPAALAGAFSLLLLSATPGIGATTAVTNPVGFLQTPCLANSDTLIAPSFTRPAVFTAALASVTGTSSNIISFTSTPTLSPNAFVYGSTVSGAVVSDHFYLIIGPASAALTGTLSVTENSATVTGTGTAFGTQVVVGDRLTINDGFNQITFTVKAIASATSLTLDRPFVDAAAGSLSVVTPTKPVVAAGRTTNVARVGAGKVDATPRTQTASTLTGLAATYDHSPYEGRWYMVTANDASTVTVNLNGDTLSSVAANTQVSIIPCWTLNTLFPAANVGTSFTASPSSSTLNTQILIPNYAAKGINISAATIYYYVSASGNTGWRSFVDSDTADHGDDFLIPDGYFTLRQPKGNPAVALTFNGAVPVNSLVTTLSTSNKRAQDNPVGLNRPMGTTLGSLGLNAADGSFVSSTSSSTLADQLLVYDNTKAVVNRSATAIYYYVNGTFNGVSNVGWRSFVDSDTADHSADVIPAGAALTIRKAITSDGKSYAWTNNANY